MIAQRIPLPFALELTSVPASGPRIRHKDRLRSQRGRSQLAVDGQSHDASAFPEECDDGECRERGLDMQLLC